MTSSEPEVSGAGSPAVVGLRERKKARTRAAIRSEAIRLFVENGYAATTVEQIAEAAEVSPSTFFRYFPTKEAVVITDEFDARLATAFRGQPAGMNSLRAFRTAIAEVFAQIVPDELEQERLRAGLMRTVPELRSAMIGQYSAGLNDLALLFAERMGRPADDVRVRTLAGAVMGVTMSVTMGAFRDDPETAGLIDTVARLDVSLQMLEDGDLTGS